MVRRYEEWLRGKTVAIIGGATWERRAEEADVVIRINQHVLRQGGRVDVIYDAMAKDPSAFFTSGVIGAVRWFVAMRSGAFYSEATMARLQAHGTRTMSLGTEVTRREPEEDSFLIGEQWFQRELRRYRTLPFTGITALLHVLHSEVRSVLVTGMTFYAEQGTVPAKMGMHDVEINRQIVRDALQCDIRLRVDEQTRESLELPVR